MSICLQQFMTPVGMLIMMGRFSVMAMCMAGNMSVRQKNSFWLSLLFHLFSLLDLEEKNLVEEQLMGTYCHGKLL